MSTQIPLPHAPFPEVWDSSMRAAFVACPRKFEFEYLHHWRPFNKSIHLTGGGAFAAALETTRRAFWDSHLSPAESLTEGYRTLLREWVEPEIDDPKSTKTLPGFLLALGDYFQHFGLATDHIQPFRRYDGKIAAEFSFALPLSSDLLHPVTGLPILYVGRSDLIGYTEDGHLWIVDEKTTTSLGDNWRSQWPMRGQFTGYTWGARQTGLKVSGVIARGVGILKKDTTFAESIQFRSDDMVDWWHTQTCRDIRRAISMWEEGYFDRAYDSACSSYSGCGYREPCQSPMPERVLSSMYIQSPWNPLEALGSGEDSP